MDHRSEAKATGFAMKGHYWWDYSKEAIQRLITNYTLKLI